MSSPTSSNTVIVYIRRACYKLAIPATMGDLQEEIEKVGNIPVASQRLLIKGKKIQNFDKKDSPDSLGIKSNTKLMVLRIAEEKEIRQQPMDTIDNTSPQMVTLRNCHEQITKLCGHLKEVVSRIQQRLGAIGSERKSLREIEEGCMRILETLDGLVIGVIDDTNMKEKTVWKEERKRLVNEGQKLLNEVDTAGKGLREWENEKLPIDR